MENVSELIENVENWADDKGLLRPESTLPQCLKVVEEVGELAKATLKKDEAGIKDGIGDAVVTLIILARQNGTTVGECLEIAYNEIKDRKGKMVGGSFIKESDLNQ